ARAIDPTKSADMAKQSAMEVVDQIQMKLDALRDVLSGDRQRWSWERRWFEILRAFKGDNGEWKNLSFGERKAASVRAGMDMRSLSGAYPETLEWAGPEKTHTRLTEAAKDWYYRLEGAHDG